MASKLEQGLKSSYRSKEKEIINKYPQFSKLPSEVKEKLQKDLMTTAIQNMNILTPVPEEWITTFRTSFPLNRRPFPKNPREDDRPQETRGHQIRNSKRPSQGTPIYI